MVAPVSGVDETGSRYHVSADPKTTESDAGAAGAEDDVLSDPAKGAGDGADWADEGGATPEGSAVDGA